MQDLQFCSFIKEFEKAISSLDSEGVRSKTFMEIAGYPHFENVSSNILAFLFDVNENHGYKDIWLKSLLRCIDLEKASYENVVVQREAQTKNGNRIDILISTDSNVICIENKIFAELDNPLSDYEKTSKEKCEVLGIENEPVLIVLSIYKQDVNKLGNFKNITYEELFSNVEMLISDYEDLSRGKWSTYIEDYIHTIRGIYMKDTISLSSEFVDFYVENNDMIHKYNDYVKTTRKVLDNRARLLMGMLSDMFEANGLIANVEQPYVYSPADYLYKSVVVNRRSKADYNLAIETSVSCWGWNISFWGRNSKSTVFAHSQIKKLKSNNLFHIDPELLDREFEIEHNPIVYTFDRDTDIKVIAERIVEIAGLIF